MRDQIFDNTKRAMLVGATLVMTVSTIARGGGNLIVSQVGTTTSLSIGTNPPFHTTDNTVQNARAIEVPNSTVVANVWDEVTPTNETLHYYALSPDGESIVRVRKTTFDLKLRHGHYDPIEDGPNAVEPSLTAGANNNLYIVQFVTQTLEVYRDALEARSAKVYNFLVNHSHIVKMTTTVKTQVEALDFVRAVVPFHPAYRVSEEIRGDLAAEFSSDQTERYSIMVQQGGDEQVNDVANVVNTVGGTVVLLSPWTARLEAVLTLDQLRTVVAMNNILFIDIPGEVGDDMDIARDISGATYVETVEGFSGQGVRGEVMDGALYVDHNAFNPTPLIHGANDAGFPEHGTKVYGVVFGDGTDSPVPAAKGVLPDGTGFFASYWPLIAEPPEDNRYDHTRELVDEAYCNLRGDPNCPYDAVFQTNSWGTGLSYIYGTTSAEMDRIIFDHDILICQSQSNEGTQLSRYEAWAKNVVSVGGIKHFNTPERVDDIWCDPVYGEDSCGRLKDSCASIGPANDGRIKPDLTHFFECILTTCDQSADCYTDGVGLHPDPFGGTSAATPITCGHFGLLFQMWHEEVFPGFGGGSSVFASRPHAATARALAINTAYRYAFTPPIVELNRDHQGWGMIDLQNLYDLRNELLIIDESAILDEFDIWSCKVHVTSNQLNVTLVYADPPGDPAADEDRMNDLSLRVISPSGVSYWGNLGLMLGNSSWPTSDPAYRDTINTVENVFIPNPESGRWTIEVSADEIAGDGHTETPQDDADFALVASGVDATGACCLVNRFGVGYCIETSRHVCEQRGGAFDCLHLCPEVYCAGTQGPSQGP